jgi:hypothetical protein
MHAGEIGRGVMDWIHVAQDIRVFQRNASVIKTKNIQFLKKEELLTNWATMGFSMGTIFHGDHEYQVLLCRPKHFHSSSNVAVLL